MSETGLRPPGIRSRQASRSPVQGRGAGPQPVERPSAVGVEGRGQPGVLAQGGQVAEPCLLGQELGVLVGVVGEPGPVDLVDLVLEHVVVPGPLVLVAAQLGQRSASERSWRRS